MLMAYAQAENEVVSEEDEHENDHFEHDFANMIMGGINNNDDDSNDSNGNSEENKSSEM
jgi:hypothetical protein